jgi:hypothetical protein
MCPMCPMCLCVSKKNFNLSADKGRFDYVISYSLLSMFYSFSL